MHLLTPKQGAVEKLAYTGSTQAVHIVEELRSHPRKHHWFEPTCACGVEVEKNYLQPGYKSIVHSQFLKSGLLLMTAFFILML
jgi:hypothetical protein